MGVIGQGHHRIFKVIEGQPLEEAADTQLPSQASPTIKERVHEVSGVNLSDVKIIDEESLQSEAQVPKDEPNRISIQSIYSNQHNINA